MSTVGIVAVVLGFLLFNVLFAYVPIILVISYTLRPKPPKDALWEDYVIHDKLSTAEWIAAEEERWTGRRHAPLSPRSNRSTR